MTACVVGAVAVCGVAIATPHTATAPTASDTAAYSVARCKHACRMLSHPAVMDR